MGKTGQSRSGGELRNPIKEGSKRGPRTLRTGVYGHRLGKPKKDQRRRGAPGAVGITLPRQRSTPAAYPSTEDCSRECRVLDCNVGVPDGGRSGAPAGTGPKSGCDGGGGRGTVIRPVPVKPGEPVKVMPKEGEPKKLPEGKEAAAPLIPESKTIEVGTKSPFELSRRFEKRVDHAADYSQLTGQLFYVHADGGLWVLRYAPLDTEDRNGGGVILARDRSMASYRGGDLVTVRGR